jgi:hypothetical protein
MRYWAYLAAKVSAAGFFLFYLWRGITWLLPDPHLIHNDFLGYDLPWTLAAGGFFIVCCGFAYLIQLDQRYRCRVCLRRLRMPITSGSWASMLQLGRPRVEYICTFGHGTLKVPALQISGLETPDWKSHGDMWDELFPLEETRK